MSSAPDVELGKDTEVEFQFERSAFFRVIHVDGAFGGPSPTGLIHMAVYSERPHIPKKVVHRIEGGALGGEVMEKRETRQGIFRELEADLVLSLETAISIRTWLDERIDQIQKARNIMAAVETSEQRGKT